MATILAQVPLTATADVLLVASAQGRGPAGWRLGFRGTGWTGSLVLKANEAAPGQAQSLVSIPFITESTGATNAADTAITTDGAYIVQPDYCAYDLYAVYTHTGGSCVVTVQTQDGATATGDLTAANIDGSGSQNTFGANVPYTGTYKFPSLFASTTALATPSALAATAFNAFASTVSGATLMGYGTTADVTLKNRAGTDVVKVGPNTTTTTIGGSLVLAGGTPAVHAINLEGITLAANTNAIRGASVNPTRTSGWTSFSGTISTSPTPCYTDYRELHSTGAAEVLGFGLFPFMDSGATGKSMYALQAICEADAGATIGAATAVGDGVFPLWAKCLVNSASVNASGVMGAAFLSFQANVTDVQALDSSMLNMEVASGGINAIFKFQCSAAKGATYFVNFENNGEPAEKTAASTTATNNVVGNIKVLVGDQVGYINLHSAKAT